MLRASSRKDRDLELSRRPARRRDRGLLRHFALESLEGRALLTGSPAVTLTGFQNDHFSSAALTSSPTGYTPAEMTTAYNINKTIYYQQYANNSGYNIVRGTGAGQTIAIIDAYSEPTIASDLSTFDSTFGLAAPPNFTVINQNGSSAAGTLPGQDPSGSNGPEEALDVEWAHAIAPQANILLVEANDNSGTNIFAAIGEARAYTSSVTPNGVSVVSMSFGFTEASGETTLDQPYFTTPSNHTSITFIASSGDYGAYTPPTTPGGQSTTVGVSYPATSPNVLAVGGTNLTLGAYNAYGGETAWGSGTSSGEAFYPNGTPAGGSGGGVSLYESQPSYQGIYATNNNPNLSGVANATTNRTVPDLSIAGGPVSAVAVYDATDFGPGGGWDKVWGTSLSAPMMAGIISIADQFHVLYNGTTLDSYYGSLYGSYELGSRVGNPNGYYATDFDDVTSGNNGYAAGASYDLVTGFGSPNVISFVNDLSPGNPTVLQNQVLPSGYSTSTLNGAYLLTMQPDGNLVYYGPNQGVIWYSGTSGNSGAYASMQSDGNLVVYSSAGKALWNSGTSGNANATLNLTTGGGINVHQAYNSGTQSSGVELWAGNTTLYPGRVLYPGQYLQSANVQYNLEMLANGNLLLYTGSGTNFTTVWSSNTAGYPGGYADMQADGNFVIYQGSTPLWSTNTSGHNNQGVTLVVLNTGQIALFLNGQEIWVS